MGSSSSSSTTQTRLDDAYFLEVTANWGCDDRLWPGIFNLVVTTPRTIPHAGCQCGQRQQHC